MKYQKKQEEQQVEKLNCPIRVLCVFSILDRGGSESMCMNLYRSIDHSKVQFDFVKHTSSVGSFEQEIETLGGHIYTAPAYRIANHFSYCNWWNQHLKAHPEHQIIHGHFFTISSVYFSVAKKRGRLTIGHSHCNRPKFNGWKRKIKQYIIMRTERFSDYCFACSLQAGQWLFPHRQFTVLNNAIDTELFKYDESIRQAVRKEFDLGDSFVIGTVGSMQEVKNPFGLIDIFETLVKKQPTAKLLWVGDGNLRINIEATIAEKGLEKSVILTGVRSDVNRLLQAMDAFILPSFSEGLPVVAIEAQTAGLPCFFSDCVTKEADITGLCTYLPISTPEIWAEAILNYQGNDRDTKTMIVDKDYDIHTTAKWLEDFYMDIIKE